jgi:hypothetical protein
MRLLGALMNVWWATSNIIRFGIPGGGECSSGLIKRIREGTATVNAHLKKLRHTLTTDPELNELEIYFTTDSAAYISEFIEFFTSQYEEYVETAMFPLGQALTTVLDLTALIFEKLHGARAEVMDTGQPDPGMFLWGFIKAWEIQEQYRQNQFKDYPALTGRLIFRMLVHDGQKAFKSKLALLNTHDTALTVLQARVTENHKEVVVYQKKLKSYLEEIDEARGKGKKQGPH